MAASNTTGRRIRGATDPSAAKREEVSLEAPRPSPSGPDISIVVTVLNEEDRVVELMGALCAQLAEGDEIVVVDGGSHDSTVERVRRHAQEQDQRVRLMQAAATNISAGRNRGIATARNEIIACTDAGCRPARGWLESLRAPFRADPRPDLVTGVYRVSANGSVELAMALACYPQVDEVASADALTRWYGRFFGRTFDPTMPTGRSVAFTRAAWERVGGFAEDRCAAEDVTFGRAIAASGGTCVLAPEAEVIWDQRPTLLDTARMYYRYGIGDGVSGDLRLIGRNMARIVAYLGGPWAVVAGGRRFRAAAVAGAGLYLSLPVRRALARPRPGPVLAALPVALAVKDLAKAAGCTSGLLRRSR